MGAFIDGFLDSLVEPLQLLLHLMPFITVGGFIGAVGGTIWYFAFSHKPKPPKPDDSMLHESELDKKYNGDRPLWFKEKVRFKELLRFTRHNPKLDERKVPRCPKCDALSLRVDRRGIIWCGLIHIGKTKHKLNTYEAHTVDNKKVIAICLECEHNRQGFPGIY